MPTRYLHIPLTVIQLREWLESVGLHGVVPAIIPFHTKRVYQLSSTVPNASSSDELSMVASVDVAQDEHILHKGHVTNIRVLSISPLLQRIVTGSVDVSKIFNLLEYVTSARYTTMFFNIVHKPMEECVEFGWKHLMVITSPRVTISLENDVKTISITTTTNFQQLFSAVKLMCEAYTNVHGGMQLGVTSDKSVAVLIHIFDERTIVDLLQDENFFNTLHSFMLC